ncbi:DUF2752 domain-containing protein [Flavobacterium sp.]|uniref:DUF2752 domain-containing protein n=1 Tax=Flavobacterium sp. TaxID=239 RepID=UPI00286E9741|nr:DUF2752 domain-containing protein [Flavobacterium sp.]
MKKNKLYKFIFLACFFGYSWLFFFNYNKGISTEIDYTVCLFKRITDYPCLSCGTTRAISYFFKGDFITAVLLNPIGIVLALIMVVSPIWISIDWYTKKQTFYNFYIKCETILKIRKVHVLLILLLILNWIWNIKKQV